MAFRKVSLVATEVEEIDSFVNSKLKLLKSFVCKRMGIFNCVRYNDFIAVFILKSYR